MDIERLPPHSIEAEEAVLGSLLIDPDALFEVSTFLRPEFFYREQNKWVYQSILDLHDRREPVDLITLTEELRRREQLEELGGEAYVIGLINIVPTSINAKHYGRIVEATALRRRLIAAATQIATLAYNEDEDVNVAIDRAEQTLFSVSEERVTRDLTPVKQIAKSYLERIEELNARGQEIIGVPTGFTDMDRMLGGLNKSDLIIVAARPGMGKCVTADTKLVDPTTGQLIDIETLVQHQQANLLTLNRDYKLGTGQPSHFVDNGLKPVYRVTTALGREIKTTFSHPFLTVLGWRPLYDLKVGDRVAVPRIIPVFGTYSAPDHEAKVLAYLLADGSLVGGSPQFTNANPCLLEDFAAAALQFPGNKIRQSTSGGQRTPTLYVSQDARYEDEDRRQFAGKLHPIWQASGLSRSELAERLQVSLSVVKGWLSGDIFPSAPNFAGLCQVLHVAETDLLPNGHAQSSQVVNTLTHWLKQVGVWGKDAAAKEIPGVVYTYTRPQLALFLNRLFACDGSIYLQNKSQPIVSYSSVSEALIKGVNHLLLRFGIMAKLRRRQIKYQGSYRSAYELRVTDSTSIQTFAQEIGAFGKEAAVAQVQARCAAAVSNTNQDTIPLEVWNLIQQAKGEQSWANLYEKMGFARTHNLHVGQRAPSRGRLQTIAQALGSPSLTQLAQSDVYWDAIVSIEPLGEQHVYDLTVPDTHNFVADDMIVHNTAMQMTMMMTAAMKHQKRVAVFSLEMSGEQLLQRMIAIETRIDSQRLRRGNLYDQEWPIFYEAIGRVSEAHIFIDDTPGITPMQLRTKCRRLYAEHGIDMVLIDYLQLMQTDITTNNRVQEISEISRSLKGLARELDVPVVAAAQLSRAVEQRQDKRPMLSDLRDSGSIEQDADIVMFIYRDDYYYPETSERKNIAEINVAKHRNGPTGSVDLFWHGELATFRNLQRQEVQL